MQFAVNKYMLAKTEVTGDIWPDGEMVSTFLYLIENPNCNIPNEWQSTMEQFYNEMKQWVPGILGYLNYMQTFFGSTTTFPSILLASQVITSEDLSELACPEPMEID